MKVLTFENIPRWYTLTIDESTGFPCFKVYSDVLAKLPQRHDPKFIEMVRRNVDLSEIDFPFQEPAGEFFGFGNALERIGEDDGQTIYRLNLPVIQKITDENCSECNGTKTGSRHDGGCLYCDSSGKKSVIDWRSARAVSASAGLFSSLLWFGEEVEREIVPTKFQFLLLTLISQKDKADYSIGGDFSPNFVKRLKSFGESCHFEKVEEAMIKAYYHMFPPKNPESRKADHEMRYFDARQKLSGNLVIDVPGDRCGVYPLRGVSDIRQDEGYDFASHNVDTPLQQLALLTGLAAVCDLVDYD